MKKVYLLLTLLATSFFFISLTKVEAMEYPSYLPPITPENRHNLVIIKTNDGDIICYSNYTTRINRTIDLNKKTLIYNNPTDTSGGFKIYNLKEDNTWEILSTSISSWTTKEFSYKTVLYGTGNFYDSVTGEVVDPFVSPDPFEEDKEIMNNFYTTIFTKISDLAISFANNYTFLLIFGIFILIFVFELIWRRFI